MAEIKNPRILWTIPLLIIAMVLYPSLCATIVYAQGDLPGIGAVGDSLTDEYSQRAWYYGDSSALNWVDLLARNRDTTSIKPELDFGVYETNSNVRGQPRDGGYEYNWSLWGANTATLVSQGQHIGLAEQVNTGNVEYVVLAIGSNDFNPTSSYGMYEAIYNQVTPFTGCDGGTYVNVQDYVDSVVDRYTLILEAMINAGGLPIMATIADFGAAPRTYNDPRYSDPDKRQHVTDTIMAVNSSLKTLAAAKGLPIVDLFELIIPFYVEVEPSLIGGVSIIKDVAPNPNGRYAILPGGAHPGTVLQGLLANAFIEACNRSYGTDFTLLSDQEILASAGVEYPAGDDTFFDIIPFVIVPSSTKYSGGTGEPNDPYQIATAEDLMLLGETPDDYDKHFILTADIDLDPNLPGRKVFDRAVIAPDVNDVEDWFQGTPFTGVFDGSGHTISHLAVAGVSHLGLFGQLQNGAEVSSLNLEAADVIGTGGYVGGLVGMNAGGHVTNCHSTGTVSGTGSWITGGVGGLVGSNGSWGWGGSSVTNCYSTGIVIGDLYVGGLVGMNTGGSITMSYSTSMVGGEGFVGGLVGSNEDGNITASHSSGAVSGDYSVGGLVGWSNGADAYITACYTTGMVSGIGQIGGLVGDNEGPVVACYSTANVSGESVVGGLVGENDQSGVSVGYLAPYGSITTSYSKGTVNGGEEVGGLVGCNYGGYIVDCYSTGEVDGDQAVGGFVGYSDSPVHINRVCVISSFWDTQTSGQTTSDGGVGLATAEMQTATTFLEAGWDFVNETVNGPNDIWKIAEGLSYPHLWWEKYGGGIGEPNNPYLIYTAEHLNEIGAERNDYNKHFKLMADIDLSGYLYDRAVIAPVMIDSDLQLEGTPFTGVLDGNGHAISNLTIEGHSYLGLFGYLDSDAIVSNLSIEEVDVNGTGDCVGGLAGSNSGSIANCYSTGKVSGNRRVGGLVGYNYYYGSIITSFSTGTVNGNSSIGGLVGYSSRGSITTSYSTGAVSGDQNVGGLVGYYGGAKLRPAVLTNCYSTSAVSGTGFFVGGLVGRKDYGTITTSFWDMQTSGQTTSDGGTGKTTTEMQTASTFLEADWDFVDEIANGTEDIWWILEGQDYPRLWWEAE